MAGDEYGARLVLEPGRRPWRSSRARMMSRRFESVRPAKAAEDAADLARAWRYLAATSARVSRDGRWLDLKPADLQICATAILVTAKGYPDASDRDSRAVGAPIITTVARTTTVAVPVIPTVIPTTVVTTPASIAVVPPAVTFTPFANTVLRPLQTVGVPKPPTTGVTTTDVTNTTPPAMDNQTDLMAVIRAMQQSIEKLQAAIENPPPQSGPHRPPGTSKTPEQTSHIRHLTQTTVESDDERRNPRSRRLEENYYEAHSTRNTYANTGGNRAERYSNAPIIIGRPFTEEIDLFPTPPNFKMPPCESYDGTGDPMEHLARFTSGMNLHLVPDQIMCRAFPVTLKGAAHVWFQHLPPRSISCWAQLAESFRSNFLTSRV
ncbi:hypothetical protein RJ639_029935 [Escallonia herrerae]|uniref:Retrotransposon gag domain-containing protein n=1 Tax=Escallonia herrerae TaxID=1293975 RepID=A0AA89BDP0_9ASTE|nr:hypothetical protein RJ639_029935 [Escallonia herrerae]